MTTFVNRKIADPAVHAFVIGVGSYRHLPGGAGPVLGDTLGLQQVLEPPLSARAFLNWLTNGSSHPLALPLGSIELLMSADGGYAYKGRPVAQATLPNAQNAVASWFDRCHSNQGNIALFYFCGHGLERDHQYLLLEDFGQAPMDPLAMSIDLNSFWDGMAACQADTQIFITDACRQVPWELIETFSTRGNPLIPPILGGNTDRNAPRLLATRKGDTALGAPGQVTYFTQALIAALSGAGGEDPNGNDKWVVSYYKLADAIQKLLAFGPYGSAVGGTRQQCRTGGESQNMVLVHLAGPPQVPVQIDCIPPETAQVAALELTSQLRNITRTRTPAEGSWQLVVPAAHSYQLAATYVDAVHPAWSRPVPVLPPLPHLNAEASP
ncbi:caspase family protein [Streptomyces sp. NRRL S-448]|uniref:caspase family protein n=1 Tax=Streptomyces sp. NRRL S-448 TaxID=1463907 RepID=UPI0035666804